MQAEQGGQTEYIRLCQELREDFDWLRRKWSEFHELYEKGQERIDLLNAAASNFFYFLHQLFFENAMLHLCRLTDRTPMFGHETLTVMALGNISDARLKTKVQSKTKEVLDNCKFARQWRDQRLAHMDLETVRNAHAQDPVVAAHIDTAIKSISELLWLVEDHFGLPHFLLAKDPWGAKSLVYYLETAKSAIEAERERYRKLAAGG